MSALLVAVFAVLLISVVVGLFQKNTNRICRSKRRLDGKTALVTGGTTGMGLETATDFAQRGARVIIACPFKDEGEAAKKLIIDTTRNENVIFKLLDLASLDSVRKFAANILNTEERLDILVNNAGVGIPGDFLTEDGLNFILQVNYFGHFLLDILLLPLLKKSGSSGDPSRIVSVSSVLHQVGKLDIENLNKTGYWFKIQLYGNSKFFFILYSRELTKRLKGSNVVINSVDPGNVGTAIFNSAGWLAGVVVTTLFKYMFKTPWEGAQTAIHVSLDEAAGAVSGEFFKNCKQTKAMRSAYDDNLASSLWNESVKLVQLSADELQHCLQ